MLELDTMCEDFKTNIISPNSVTIRKYFITILHKYSKQAVFEFLYHNKEIYLQNDKYFFEETKLTR